MVDQIDRVGGGQAEEKDVSDCRPWKCFYCYDQLYYRQSYSDGSQDREKRPCLFCLPDEYAMWQRKRSKEFLANCCVVIIGIVIIVVIANLIGLGMTELTRP